MKKRLIRQLPICPKCGSLKVKSTYLLSPMEMGKISSKLMLQGYDTGENPSIYLCLECNYYGTCPQINMDNIKKFRKNVKQNKSKERFKQVEKEEILVAGHDWISKNKWFKYLFLLSLANFFSSNFFLRDTSTFALSYIVISSLFFLVCGSIVLYHRIWKKRFKKQQ